MQNIINFFLELIEIWKEEINKNDLYLGGGTALMLKYKHRVSYDLDFFIFKKVDVEKLLKNLAFKLPYNYDFSLEYPILIVSNKKYTTKIEIHVRDKVKLLGYEVIFNIKKLSDLDILLEKIYFIERNKEVDLIDIKLILSKYNFTKEFLVNKLSYKFNVDLDYSKYLVETAFRKLREFKPI